MKKIILALMATCLLSVASFAQTKEKKATGTQKPATTTTATPKKETKAAATTTKKDGTPDMRYKENKEAAKAQKTAGPTKKDGTPDKRFKENKAPKDAKAAPKADAKKKA